MVWVTFTRDFDFSPEAMGGRVTVAYKAGMTKNVTRECAAKALASGRIEQEAAEDVGGEEEAGGDAGR
ncbi:MAG: hypothetical protein BGN85_08795 [Alphaproteobacteria bacterium 64-11]|nr:MAG: hypothetical protein BGN85_08795 [Alphaproteobacteria bacterium 64-11]